MKTMPIKHGKKWLLLVIGCGLLCILAACGTNPSLAATQLATQANNSTPSQSNGSVSPTVNTVAVPPAQTSCPTTGTARAWVTAPLALGKHANLVYTVNEYNGQTPTFGTLKRYDVATQSKTEIVKLANVFIDDAQVSADGQWLLFESNNNSVNKLQAVRMDGQGLQTLYCSSSAIAPQWSTNQKLIAFTQLYSNNTSAILLLHTKDGSLETVFSQPRSPREYDLRTWLDTTRLYLVRTQTDAPPDVLAVLDTNKGANQTASNLITVVDRGGKQMPMYSFDSSYDGSQLFVDRNTCAYGCTPPSDITVQPALGGTEHTILHSTILSITNVRAVTANTLLLTVNSYSLPGGHSDTSKNGLWSVHTDGTKLTRLTTDSTDQRTEINAPFPWSNVSRDGTLYAATQLSNFKAQHPTNAILIGSLSGGTPTTIASIADGTTLTVTGWTTM